MPYDLPSIMTPLPNSPAKPGRSLGGRGRHGGWFALLLLGVLLSGCATVPAAGEKELHAPLMVSRAGGTAVLSWESKLGELYTVLYTDGSRQGTEWQPMEGVTRIPGTGREIRVQDRIPSGRTRHYRLMVLPSR